MTTVSEKQPPNVRGGVEYWERTSDPFHADAFKGVDLKGATVVTVGGSVTEGDRKDGWMGIEWTENPIGFIPDGTPIDGEPAQFVIQPGPFGHLCAYPIDSPKIKEHEGKDWRTKA